MIQEPGTQRDYGNIGFKRHPHAAYFVFPRPLPPKGCVVGINYQLVEEPVVKDLVQAEDLKPKPRAAKVKAAGAKRAEPRPVEHNFTVTVRRTATWEDKVLVKDMDRAAAEQRAMEMAKRKPFKMGDAEVREEVVRAE